MGAFFNTTGRDVKQLDFYGKLGDGTMAASRIHLMGLRFRVYCVDFSDPLEFHLKVVQGLLCRFFLTL